MELPFEKHTIDLRDTTSEGDEAGTTVAPAHSSAAKRNYVTRACDSCKRKKIKCNGEKVRHSILVASGIKQIRFNKILALSEVSFHNIV
jgi:hypothetical protein